MTERARFSPIQALGLVAALASLAIAVAPTLVHDPSPAADLFEATERHVRWGLGVGVGAVFALNPWRRPWSVLIAWLALCVLGGYLLARFVGITMEGPSNLMQWVLVGVEVAICAVAAFWVRHRRDAPDRV